MKKFNNILNGKFREEYPPFYAFTKVSIMHPETTKVPIIKFADYHQYHLKSIIVSRLYKPISRMITVSK